MTLDVLTQVVLPILGAIGTATVAAIRWGASRQDRRDAEQLAREEKLRAEATALQTEFREILRSVTAALERATAAVSQSEKVHQELRALLDRSDDTQAGRRKSR